MPPTQAFCIQRAVRELFQYWFHSYTSKSFNKNWWPDPDRLTSQITESYRDLHVETANIVSHAWPHCPLPLITLTFDPFKSTGWHRGACLWSFRWPRPYHPSSIVYTESRAWCSSWNHCWLSSGWQGIFCMDHNEKFSSLKANRRHQCVNSCRYWCLSVNAVICVLIGGLIYLGMAKANRRNAIRASISVWISWCSALTKVIYASLHHSQLALKSSSQNKLGHYCFVEEQHKGKEFHFNHTISSQLIT